MVQAPVHGKARLASGSGSGQSWTAGLIGRMSLKKITAPPAATRVLVA